MRCMSSMATAVPGVGRGLTSDYAESRRMRTRDGPTGPPAVEAHGRSCGGGPHGVDTSRFHDGLLVVDSRFADTAPNLLSGLKEG
jgi:hypothetical protein